MNKTIAYLLLTLGLVGCASSERTPTAADIAAYNESQKPTNKELGNGQTCLYFSHQTQYTLHDALYKYLVNHPTLRVVAISVVYVNSEYTNGNGYWVIVEEKPTEEAKSHSR